MDGEEGHAYQEYPPQELQESKTKKTKFIKGKIINLQKLFFIFDISPIYRDLYIFIMIYISLSIMATPLGTGILEQLSISQDKPSSYLLKSWAFG
ncbi:MAG TPA: hypothetical protein GXX37_01975 [Clostridiaceae bacterium]|nr:hypothetical protein [Clostridiaceae bacterium]